jgi:hypothetical protein
MGYRPIKDKASLDFSPFINTVAAEKEAAILEKFKPLVGGTPETIDLQQFIDRYAAKQNKKRLTYELGDVIDQAYKEKLGRNFDYNDVKEARLKYEEPFNERVKSKISQYDDSPLGRRLGAGAEGEVYELAGYPDRVIKFGRTFKTDDVEDLVNSSKAFADRSNIATIERAFQKGYDEFGNSYLASIMPNLNAPGREFNNLSKQQVLAKLEKDVNDLMDKGFSLDVRNIDANFAYNPKTNVVDIYDLSKPAKPLSEGSRREIIAKLRDKFSQPGIIPDNVSPLQKQIYLNQNIVDNVPMMDKVAMMAEPGDLVRRASNKSGIQFKDGRMFKLNSGTGKQSIHFTGSGAPVESHHMGNWDYAGTSYVLPYADFGSLNGMPRSTALGDVYWWNPRQFEFPKTTKVLTSDMELAANMRNSGFNAEFSKESYKIQRQLKDLIGKYGREEAQLTPEWQKLLQENARIHNDWIRAQNPQPINNASKNVNLGSLESRHFGDVDNPRSARSTSSTPYIHSETPEYATGWKGNPNARNKIDAASDIELSTRYNNELSENFKTWDDYDKNRYWDDYSMQDRFRLSHVDRIQAVQKLTSASKPLLTEYLKSLKNLPARNKLQQFELNTLEEFLKTGKIKYRYQSGGSLPQFQPGGTNKPIPTSDMAKVKAYKDSLDLYNRYPTPRNKQSFMTRSNTVPGWFDNQVQRLPYNNIKPIAFNLESVDRAGYHTAIYAEPKQPYTYNTTTSSTPSSTSENKTLSGTLPPLKQWQYMNTEEKKAAIKKYGDPNTWPFPGVRVPLFEEGGSLLEFQKKGEYKPNFESRSQAANRLGMQRDQGYIRTKTPAEAKAIREKELAELKRKTEGVIRQTTDADKEAQNRQDYTLLGRAQGLGRGDFNPLTVIAGMADLVNPAALYYAGKDFGRGVKQTGQGIYNLDADQVASGLTQAGLSALQLAPAASTLKSGIKAITPSILGNSRYVNQADDFLRSVASMDDVATGQPFTYETQLRLNPGTFSNNKSLGPGVTPQLPSGSLGSNTSGSYTPSTYDRIYKFQLGPNGTLNLARVTSSTPNTKSYTPSSFGLNAFMASLPQVNTVGNVLESNLTPDQIAANIESIKKIKSKDELMKELGYGLNHDINTGSFNEGVYKLKNYPGILVKFEDPRSIANFIGFEDYKTYDLAQAQKNLTGSNFGNVLHQMDISPSERALFLKQVSGNPFKMHSLGSLSKIDPSSITEFYKNLKTVRNENLGFDFIGDNYYYDRNTKSFNMFDFSPTVLKQSKESDNWMTHVLKDTDLLNNANLATSADPNLPKVFTGMNLKDALVNKLHQDFYTKTEEFIKEFEKKGFPRKIGNVQINDKRDLRKFSDKLNINFRKKVDEGLKQFDPSDPTSFYRLGGTLPKFQNNGEVKPTDQTQPIMYSRPYPFDLYAGRNKVVSQKDVDDYNAYIQGNQPSRNFFYETHDLTKDQSGNYMWNPKKDVDYQKAIQNTSLGQFVDIVGGISKTSTDQFGNQYDTRSTGLEMGYNPYNIWASPSTGIGFYGDYYPGNILMQLDHLADKDAYPTIYFLNNKNYELGNAKDWESAQDNLYGKENLSTEQKERLAVDNLMRFKSLPTAYEIISSDAPIDERYVNTFGYKNDLVRLVNPNLNISGALPINKELLAELRGIEEGFTSTNYEDQLNKEIEIKKMLLTRAGIPVTDENLKTLMHYNYTPLNIYSEINRPGYPSVYKDIKKKGGSLPEFQTGGEDSSETNPKVLPTVNVSAKPQWIADKEKYGTDYISWYESWNPEKWGLNDYSNYSSFNSAFRNARENKEDEFVYKGERYNTKLVPKEESDLYWESKNFLKDYYKNQPYKKIDNAYDFGQNVNPYIRSKYGNTFLELYEKQKKFPQNSPEYLEIDKKLSAIIDEDLKIKENRNKEYDAYYKKNIIDKQNAERIAALDKPTYFSITNQKPKDMSEDGYWNPKENKMFMLANTEPGKLNTTYVHELSHKGDDVIDVMNTVPPINLEAFNASPYTRNFTQESFNYVSDPSETEARKLSTLFYLQKNKQPWKAGKITEETLDKLYQDHYDEKLPYDISQLLMLYGAQRDDLLKYLNGDFEYNYKPKEKKKGGESNVFNWNNLDQWFKNGGESDFANNIYDDYMNGIYDGTPLEGYAKKVYDKLNTMYYAQAKQSGMTPPNYIMSNIIKKSTTPS